MLKLIFASFISSVFNGLCFFIFWYLITSQFSWGLLTFIVAFVFSFIVTLFFGIPITLMLKKFNRLDWLSITSCGFSLAFIVYYILSIIFTSDGAIFIQSLATGMVGLITSAAFYKSLLLIENRETKKAP